MIEMGATPLRIAAYVQANAMLHLGSTVHLTFL